MHSARPTVVQPYAVSTQRLRAVSFQTDCGATRSPFYSYWEKAPRLCYRTLKLQAKTSVSSISSTRAPRGRRGRLSESPCLPWALSAPATLGVSSVGDRPQALP